MGLGIYFVPRSNSVIVNRLITAIRQFCFNPSDMNRLVKRTPEEEADFQEFIKDKDSTWGTNMDDLFTSDEDEDKVFELHKQDSSTPTNEPVSKVIPAERLNEPKKVISGKKTNKATVGATAKQ